MTEPVTRPAPGTPCWVSLMAHSLAATEEFYGALFGWTFVPGPRQLGPYVRAQLDGREVAGMGTMSPGRHLAVSWTTYLATDDADATAEQIRACGGTVAVGPLDAGDVGRLAIGSDPFGTVFGIWQREGAVGARAAGCPGSQVWDELLVPDVTVVKFYESLFGYETENEGPELVTLRAGGRPVAAVRASEGSPRWMTYFETADTDATARRVAELGGRVLTGPRDDPSGRRTATVADPEGAVFSLAN